MRLTGRQHQVTRAVGGGVGQRAGGVGEERQLDRLRLGGGVLESASIDAACDVMCIARCGYCMWLCLQYIHLFKNTLFLQVEATE